MSRTSPSENAVMFPNSICKWWCSTYMFPIFFLTWKYFSWKKRKSGTCFCPFQTGSEQRCTGFTTVLNFTSLNQCLNRKIAKKRLGTWNRTSDRALKDKTGKNLNLFEQLIPKECPSQNKPLLARRKCYLISSPFQRRSFCEQVEEENHLYWSLYWPDHVLSRNLRHASHVPEQVVCLRNHFFGKNFGRKARNVQVFPFQKCLTSEPVQKESRLKRY